MSNAADKLARTRLAIIAHVQRREHRHNRGADRDEPEPGRDDREWSEDGHPAGVGGWFASLKRAVGTWWRHHPAHAGLELATPVLSDYAARKPFQYLGIAALIGAVVVVARPWRLISVTGLLVTLVKSSQLSSMVLSAMSAAYHGQDRRPPV
jgi:hypothetical protein